MGLKKFFSRNDSALFPYEEEAYVAHDVTGVATDGCDVLWEGTLGVLAKRKRDGLWATAMIGDGWHNNRGQCKLSCYQAIMTGIGHKTAWQAWKHREDKA